MSSIINKRLGMIVELAEKKPGLGKTAMMKFIYLIQEFYNVPLNYDFEIYTYGPYSSEVMGDIDTAIHNKAISKETYYYPNAVGYKIQPAENAKQIVDRESSFIKEYKKQIQTVVRLYGDKTASELELISTTAYIYKLAQKNKWSTSIEEVSESVKEIKPHFSIEEIESAYSFLEENKVIA